MSVHESIISVYSQLGYAENPQGCCHGISMRWLEAYFTDEEAIFDDRIQMIDSHLYTIVDDINAAKAKKGVDLSHEDQRVLDILSFYDHLHLHQDPGYHGDLFHKSHALAQEDINDISPIAASDKMNGLGGIVPVFSQPGTYNETELSEHLTGISDAIERHKPKDGQPFGMICSSPDHTISLGYKKGHGWTIMDINQYPPKRFETHDTQMVASILSKGFKKEEGITFNTTVIVPGNYKKIFQLQTDLEQFKKEHALSETMALGKESADLAYLAVQYGDVESVAKLMEYGTDFNALNSDGNPPVFVAARSGKSQVIALLATNKTIDLNQMNDEGDTPACAAAFNGHAEVISVLRSEQGDLTTASADGLTPAMIAASEGHVDVMNELIKAHIDLDQADAEGQSLPFIAASMNHPQIIAVLRDNKANLNQSNKTGQTALMLAAQEGYGDVILELAKGTVNLNEKGHLGHTPGFSAILNGQSSALIALVKYGADVTTPFIDSPHKLQLMADEYSDEAASRMKAYIFLHRGKKVSITLYDLACILGQDSLIPLLEKAKEIRAMHLVIDQLKSNAIKLGELSFELASKLEQLTTYYTDVLSSSNNKAELKIIRIEFEQTLLQIYKSILHSDFKPSLKEITEAAEALGLVKDPKISLSQFETFKKGIIRIVDQLDQESRSVWSFGKKEKANAIGLALCRVEQKFLESGDEIESLNDLLDMKIDGKPSLNEAMGVEHFLLPDDGVLKEKASKMKSTLAEMKKDSAEVKKSSENESLKNCS